MKIVLALTAIVFLVSGCETVDPIAVRNAEIWFPPRFRHVETPDYCFSAAERERALQEYRQLGADTLFEIVVDSAGKVRRARLVKTNQPAHRHENMVSHARAMTFSPEAESDQYRAFYYPTQYTYESEFDWAD